MALARRGVTAKVIGHSGRSTLHVTRHGESFSIDAPPGQQLRAAVFLGSCTDRYLAMPTEDGDGGVSVLHVFDLEERTCFQCGKWCHEDYSVSWIDSMVCSGSGRHIAAVAGEGRGRTDFIFVASVDRVVRTTSIVSIINFWTEGKHYLSGFEQLPCFVGTRASVLVGVRRDGGVVFLLGREEVGTGAWLQHPPECMGRMPVQWNDTDYSLEEVIGVPGTDSMLALLTISLDEFDPWGHCAWVVVETIVSLGGLMSGKASKWHERGVAISIPISIRHEIGTGVHVCLYSGSCVVLSEFYSMEFGMVRQSWIEACIRASSRANLL